MQVKLKGINRVKVTAADGSKQIYYYYGKGKGALRLDGEFGSADFFASYQAAVNRKIEKAPGKLLELMNRYQRSAEFAGLADRTRSDYIKHIRKIEKRFGGFPLAALTDRRCRAEFLEWRDELARSSRRQADYTFTVFARILSFGLDRGITLAHPLEKHGRLYRGSRADNVWTAENEAAFMSVASPELRLAFVLAIWTGQRQGDLLRLPWSAYDGNYIRLKQSKTGVLVRIPVAGPLKDALVAAPRRSTIILTNSKGVPWSANGFRRMWRVTSIRAGIEGLTFNDLRGTAVTRMIEAGNSHGEVAIITGHSTRDVGSILDRHYVGRRALIADEAIVRYETGTEVSKSVSKNPTGPSGNFRKT